MCSTMSLFMMVNPWEHDAPFPSFEKPCLVGEMHVEGDDSISIGRHKARYLVERLVGGECSMDLNAGYSTFEDRDSTYIERMSPFLKWIEFHSVPGSSLKKVCHEVDFVCYRGILSKIASTPFDRDGWRAAIVRFKGVNFIYEFPTDERIQQLESLTQVEKLRSYWGRKFEQCITSGSPKGEPNVNERVSNVEEFDVIMKAKFGKGKSTVRVLYAGETDCIDTSGDYVELKTQRMEFDDTFYHFKARKWWLQSFLVGIQSIVAGIRDDNGIVTRVERVRVSDLPKFAVKWSANVTLNFMLTVLHRFKEILAAGPELTYHLVESEPRRLCLTIQELPRESEFAFLNDHFIEHFRSE